jgi:hypothetical protein
MLRPYKQFYGAGSDPEIIEVAEKFVLANCYDPKIAMKLFHDMPEVPGMEIVES